MMAASRKSDLVANWNFSILDDCVYREYFNIKYKKLEDNVVLFYLTTDCQQLQNVTRRYCSFIVFVVIMETI